MLLDELNYWQFQHNSDRKAQLTGSSAYNLVTTSLLVARSQKITSFYLDSGVFNAKLIVQFHSDSGEESITGISSKHN